MKSILISLITLGILIIFANDTYSAELRQCNDGNCEGDLIYYLAQYVHIDADIIVYPKIMNIKSDRRIIITGIRFQEGYDPHDIDEESLELTIQSCIGCRIIFPDCGYPSQGRYIAIFPRQGLRNYIETVDLEFPTKMQLKITGELKDGTPFEGLNTIWVVK